MGSSDEVEVLLVALFTGVEFGAGEDLVGIWFGRGVGVVVGDVVIGADMLNCLIVFAQKG